MKYLHKCPICNKEATRKYKNVYFCDTCVKKVRKYKSKLVFKEILIYSLGQGTGIYTYSTIKLK